MGALLSDAVTEPSPSWVTCTKSPVNQPNRSSPNDDLERASRQAWHRSIFPSHRDLLATRRTM